MLLYALTCFTQGQGGGRWFNSFGRAVEDAVHSEIRLHPANSLSEAIEAVSILVQRYEKLIPSEFRLVK